ncbi:MAG: Gfo/Idh/MocA family oxidoreductase [Caldilineaceae bacterium SB0665_bin_25]|nr:Gfo/Idh/MocA family oxidoreductase [Caldilineaceae bacterium SB0665_bin_25]
MDKIPLAIVGCGGMGHRHLYGLAELHSSGLSPFELVGACDPVRANAESLADDAEERLGTRPQVVESLEELEALGVAAVDITTTPRYHHTVAEEALERGWHAMIEKPVGLTVRAGNRIRQAAERSGRIVSVAENYRRDPMNRLGKALLDAGVIGSPRLMIHNTMGGGSHMTISVWRHQKNESGVLLDVGVHFADILEFYLGPVSTVYAQSRLHEPIRYNPAAGPAGQSSSNPAGVYGKWQRQMPAQFEATAEDASYATLLFENGAVGQFIEDHAAHGQGVWTRQIHGSAGSLELPPDRSGQLITLHKDGETVSDASLLDLVPDFHLEPIAAALFGGERLWGYDFPFHETDRKLIAAEYGELGLAIEDGGAIEVDAAQGTRSVALSYAMLESSEAGRALTMEEVLAEKVDTYQLEIDEELGLV